jgi:hypothetical protein
MVDIHLNLEDTALSSSTRLASTNRNNIVRVSGKRIGMVSGTYVVFVLAVYATSLSLLCEASQLL